MGICTVAVFAAAIAFAPKFQVAPDSPKVNADRTVSFAVRAPKAESVSLSLEGHRPIPMKKDDRGYWTAGIEGPLEPDIYGYSFVIDGQSFTDPMNPETKPNLIWPSSLLTVPGDPPRVWEVQDVPHGTVHHHFFRSGLIGDQRDFVVYTPPGYAHRKGRLPVLYLLHGYSDSAIGWTEVGKAHVILDNLIAAKKAKPMIVVMPLGYGVPGFGNRNGGGFSNPANVTLNFERFRASLLTEVMPIVENEYRVDQRRESRAIAGLSMGGAETLFTGLPYSDKFAYVGAFSTGGLRNDAAETTFKDLDAKDVNRLKVFWMVCGTDDGLIDFQRGFADAMKKRGVNVKTKETPGGHVWMLWRRNLAEFAQMLFR